VLKPEYIVTWEEINEKIEVMQEILVNSNEKVFGIPHNGAAISELMDNAVEKPENATVLIGLIHNTGETYNKWRGMYPEKEIVFLYNTQFEHQDTTLVFPWDKSLEDCL
tara:strand:- start:7024 stop:7350 length:327 start_codon:yes stop_codon:yes gene_type:complete